MKDLGYRVKVAFDVAADDHAEAIALVRDLLYGAFRNLREGEDPGGLYDAITFQVHTKEIIGVAVAPKTDTR